jgi:hypothetical protein
MALQALLIPVVNEIIKEFTKDEKDDGEKSRIKREIAREIASVAIKESAKDTRPFWKSKRWYMTILAVLIPILNRALALNLSETEIAMIAGPVVAYVASKSWEQKS